MCNLCGEGNKLKKDKLAHFSLLIKQVNKSLITPALIIKKREHFFTTTTALLPDNLKLFVLLKGTNGETESLELDKESRLSYDDFAVTNEETIAEEQDIFEANRSVRREVKTKGNLKG